MTEKNIEYYWNLKGFTPNEKQKNAILHKDGPLFLTAGPGSGKTRVILWRTVNLIVFHKVDPKKIFLATFTEKAAHQLKDGLRTLLGMVTNETDQPYDISGMAIGTVHSICQDILLDRDRRFSEDGIRSRAPQLIDSLGQYFKIYRRSFWHAMLEAGGYMSTGDIEADEEAAQRGINEYFSGKDYYSRHLAVTNIINIFNRFSEENLDPSQFVPDSDVVKKVLKMYAFYCESHKGQLVDTVDFSLLQQKAYEKIISFAGSQDAYDYVIVDEYQDTNSIQEQIYFSLAVKSKNICVVGDDDQALYRFRGATVENLVEFESRCLKYLGEKPTRIDLDINYRSKKKIVNFYTEFIDQSDWEKETRDGFYRVADKNIQPYNQEDFPAVVTTEKEDKAVVIPQIAQLVFNLKEKGKIEDYNQVAFLFPSLSYMGAKNPAVDEMETALADLGIPVFAPRAGRFLDISESRKVFGLIMQILGRPSHSGPASSGLREFREWQKASMQWAEELMDNDTALTEYVNDRREEIKRILSDHEALMKVVKKNKWDINKSLKLDMMKDLASASGLSPIAKSTLGKSSFIGLLKKKEQAKEPVSLRYVINRVTSVDWSVLDLFYQLNGFKHFQEMYEHR